jgi:prophage regulatory protein
MKKPNGPIEPLLPRDAAPPLQPDGDEHAPAEPRVRQMLNERQLLGKVPFSRTTLWRMEKKGEFPKGRYISANRKIWFEDEVVAWQNALDQGRRTLKH